MQTKDQTDQNHASQSEETWVHCSMIQKKNQQVFVVVVVVIHNNSLLLDVLGPN